jgi:hypothetical protein
MGTAKAVLFQTKWTRVAHAALITKASYGTISMHLKAANYAAQENSIQTGAAPLFLFSF